MKKLITTLVALAGISAASYAQTRTCNISFGFTSPQFGSALPCTDSFGYGYIAINAGPDALLSGDTVWLFNPRNEQGYANYAVLTGTVNAGDTVLNGVMNMTVGQIKRYVDVATETIKYTNANPLNFNDTIGLSMFVSASNGSDIADATGGSTYIKVYHGCATGINDLTKTNISVFPNPAQNQITVNFDALTSNATLRVIDIMGRTILTKEVTKNTTAYAFDISSLNNGAYYLELVSGEVRGTNKFVVSK